MSRTHDFRHVPVAKSLFQRTFGLMGRTPSSGSFSMYFPNASTVHTWFMRSSVDLVFLNEEGEVVAIRERVRPWKRFSEGRRAKSVLELPPGQLRGLDVSVGDYALLPRQWK